MSNSSDWDNTSFTVSVVGNYNITYIANDSSGNLNASITSNFTVVAAAVVTSTSSSSGGGGGSAGGSVSVEDVEEEEEEVVEETEGVVVEDLIVEESIVEGLQRAAAGSDESLLNYSYIFGGIGLLLVLLSGIMFVVSRFT